MAVKIAPASVPIKNLLGPASTLYSKAVPPTILSFSKDGFSMISSFSTGPYSSFLISHQSTLPSVDVVTHSEPVLDMSQEKLVTGS